MPRGANTSWTFHMPCAFPTARSGFAGTAPRTVVTRPVGIRSLCGRYAHAARRIPVLFRRARYPSFSYRTGPAGAADIK
jgi:hypothetical protein